MKIAKLVIAAALTAGAFGSAMAQGNVVDGSGKPIRTASGDCVRNGGWAVGKGAMGCDGVAAAAPAAAAAAPAAKAAAPAAPAKAEMKKKAKKAAKPAEAQK